MKDSYGFPVATQFSIEHPRQPVFIAATCGGCLTVCVTFNNEWTEKCKCSNNLAVFGGLQYPAYTAKNKRIVTEHIMYDDDDFEKVRKYAFRGTRGMDGKNKLEYKSISKMSDGHIANTLEYGGAGWHLKLLARELQYRFENKFRVKDNGENEDY
jgi:hypothetical protein